ncbi:MAG TPA: hypothetical protein VGH38_04085 [Bryobacteraceae bacterium]
MDIEKTMQFILEQQANVSVKQAKAEDEMAEIRQIAKRTDRRLDRAIELAVREARAERSRRRELDATLSASHTLFEEELAKLAAAQRKTEATLEAFIDSMRRGGNGH